MRPVRILMHERRKDWNLPKPRHARRARHKVCRLIEKFYDNAVRAPDILIHNQPDKMPLVKHFVHLADAAPIGYVHTNQRAVLVDKFVRALGFCFLATPTRGIPFCAKAPPMSSQLSLWQVIITAPRSEELL